MSFRLVTDGLVGIYRGDSERRPKANLYHSHSRELLSQFFSPETISFFPARPNMEPTINWREVVGPVYSKSGFADALGIDEGALQQLDQSNQVASFKSSGGGVYYPAFQLAGGQLVGGLAQLVRAASESSLSELEFAAWMNKPRQSFAGKSAWQTVNDEGRVTSKLLAIIREFDSEVNGSDDSEIG